MAKKLQRDAAHAATTDVESREAYRGPRFVGDANATWHGARLLLVDAAPSASLIRGC